MAHYLSEQQIHDLKEAFTSWDLDSDGKIAADDLDPVLRQCRDPLIEKEDREEIKSKCLSSASVTGQVSWPAFLSLVGEVIRGKELWMVFNQFDANGDGFLSVQELLQAMTTLDEVVTSADVQRLVREGDLNSDGVLSFAEFRKMVEDDRVPNGVRGRAAKRHVRRLSERAASAGSLPVRSGSSKLSRRS